MTSATPYVTVDAEQLEDDVSVLLVSKYVLRAGVAFVLLVAVSSLPPVLLLGLGDGVGTLLVALDLLQTEELLSVQLVQFGVDVCWVMSTECDRGGGGVTPGFRCSHLMVFSVRGIMTCTRQLGSQHSLSDDAHVFAVENRLVSVIQEIRRWDAPEHTWHLLPAMLAWQTGIWGIYVPRLLTTLMTSSNITNAV